jgi:medium-chain acyl-[acyl-carrier-protein] hydrolase
MASPWYIRPLPRPEAEARLYCFPFAGGAASAYRCRPSVLPGRVELRAIQPPGRQNRIAEPPHRSCRELVAELVGALAEELNELPFAFFGHSMGALVSFELARELRRRGGPQPALLGISAFEAPQRRRTGAPLSGLPDEDLVARVREFGGLPDEVLAAPELLALVVPTLRADLALTENYRYSPGPPLDCPISVFRGRDDPFARAEGLRDWQAQSTRPLTMREFPGRHFYSTEHADAVVSSFADHLCRLLPTDDRFPTSGVTTT